MDTEVKVRASVLMLSVILLWLPWLWTECVGLALFAGLVFWAVGDRR